MSVVLGGNDLAVIELLTDDRVGYPGLFEDLLHLSASLWVKIEHSMDNVPALSRQ